MKVNGQAALLGAREEFWATQVTIQVEVPAGEAANVDKVTAHLTDLNNNPVDRDLYELPTAVDAGGQVGLAVLHDQQFGPDRGDDPQVVNIGNGRVLHTFTAQFTADQFKDVGKGKDIKLTVQTSEGRQDVTIPSAEIWK
jgi:hypothetical protein